ncbi:ATP-dependent endonuclease [Ralstonia sp. NFACC01]|uniref:ATP-dependent nuclease n=1 Tax=Ralstonia sp. NFACC01 TaxID=1566294 RepID=UPI0008E24A68|nr:AAA family ATPase [Ralstonia sp. NFACC01]SFO90491.1 AAA domain-containing protein, putative AbiEii toxin, Type IV TA system [Ralstonia sp. NFACC01]
MTSELGVPVEGEQELPQKEITAGLFPLQMHLPARPGTSEAGVSLSIHTPVTTLLGPNGTGKTQVMRGLKASLANLLPQRGVGGQVRFLAAGRVAPLEGFRSALTATYIPSDAAAVGHISQTQQRWGFESIVGDVLALHDRPDLRIKVEARLHKLFKRNLTLEWTQTGLQVGFSSKEGRFFTNTEASGVLHLIGILTALYDDNVAALLIDEPEISLHPQLQAFLLGEINNVAGDPLSDSSKKIVVISTHSPSMLKLRTVADLPGLVFFTNRVSAPVQLSPTDSILQRRKLAAFVSRIAETHKSAFFSETVLLVEGPSDEIIVNALEQSLKCSLAGNGVSVLPVIGKGEFSETLQLFRLIGKRVAVLADLDALADDASLINSFQVSKTANELAIDRAHDGFAAMAAKVKSVVGQVIRDHGNVLADLSATHRYLSDLEDGKPTDKATTRAAYVSLLTTPIEQLEKLSCGTEIARARRMLDSFLEVLEAAGCFVLRRGTIEDYYFATGFLSGSGKPEAAVNETLGFADLSESQISERYADVVRAILHVAPDSRFDENLFLRSHLASALALLFQMAQATTADGDLEAIVKAASPQAAALFKFAMVDDLPNGKMAINVDMRSSLFLRRTFPAVVTREENLSQRVDQLLPPIS